MNTEQARALPFAHIAPELRVFLGDDCLAALKRELERNHCQRALVVCGRSVGASAAIDLLRSALGPALAGVCTAAREHSPLPAVEEAARFMRAVDADAVIAVGGGSAAVTGRAATILLAEGKPARELCTRRLADGTFDSPRLNAAKLPQFVVPTTPSTAFAKVGSAIHDAAGERLALFDPKSRARGIFIHPQFLATAPEALVRSASLNTLANAVEALESPRCDPFSEAMLMQALRLLGAGLPGLASPGSGARERLAVAAILCGRGTERGGTGLASVLAHAIGQRSHTANGIVSAIVLPHTLRFNAPAITQRSGAVVDGLASVYAGSRPAEGVSEASAVVEALLARLPVPRRLRDIGVLREDLKPIAQAAMADWFIVRIPRAVPDTGTLLSILEAAW
jgi:alcohol dehydrogenase class IV